MLDLQAEDIVSDGLEADEEAVEALLAKAPQAPSGADASEDIELLSMFADGTEDDLEAEDEDDAAAYSRELNALVRHREWVGAVPLPVP